MKKQVFEGLLFCFHSHSPCFFKFFCPREKSEFHWKVGSCNVWLGVRSTPQADLPLRAGWQLTHGAGSASHTLLCAVPAGAETAAGIPLKTNPLVCPCCNQIRVDMEGKKKKRKKRKYGKEATEGAFSATAALCAVKSYPVEVQSFQESPVQWCSRFPHRSCSIVVSARSSTALQKYRSTSYHYGSRMTFSLLE